MASTSSLNLSQEELKAVEQTRQKLFQLSNSIGSLMQDVQYSGNSLPNLDSLQASADILQRNMESLLEILAGAKREPNYRNYESFSRIAVHPSTNFPGRTHENILFQLLRKKPEPDVAASMDEGREIFQQLASASSGENTETRDTKANDKYEKQGDEVSAALDDKWADARDFFFERIQKYFEEEASDPYTAEEREMGVENVRTGLKRSLEEDDEEEEGEGEGDEDVQMLDGPQVAVQGSTTKQTTQQVDEGLPLEVLLRVATVGSAEEQTAAAPRR